MSVEAEAKSQATGLAVEEAVADVAPGNVWRAAIAIAAFASLWAMVVLQLHPDWLVYPEYHYGWFVPLFSLVFLVRRWVWRPEPDPPRHVAVPAGVFVLLALTLLPVRLMAQAFPEWRLSGWMLTIVVCGLSLTALYLLGGRRWLGFMAFPVLFMLVAVPWPVPLEQKFVQASMRAVAVMSVEILSLFDVPALVSGNLVRVSSGVIGIAEACSGFRSFQTALMLSLLLGELQRLAPSRRAMLVVAGAIVAFAVNVGRSSALAFLGAREGTESIERWHDLAGMLALASCIALIWGLSTLMDGGGWRRERSSLPAGTIPGGLSIFLAGWILLLPLFAMAWSGGSGKTPEPRDWVVEWPAERHGFRAMEIPGPSQRQLQFEEGSAAVWRGGNGHEWMLASMEWAPGPRASLARFHGPEACFAAVGWVFEADLGTVPVEIGGRSFSFHGYRFRSPSAPLHVFRLIESSGEMKKAFDVPFTTLERFRFLWNRRVNPGERVLEVAVAGPATAEEAVDALRRELAGVILVRE